MKRVVCGMCGKVSVEYMEQTVRILPDRGDADVAADEPTRRRISRQRCYACTAHAVFMTPRGLACHPHAWEEASGQGTTDDDVWVPILIDHAARRPDRIP